MDNYTNEKYFQEAETEQLQLVVFDIDGTLIDSEEYDASLFKQAIKSVIDIEIGDDWSSYRNVTDGGILDEIIDTHGITGNKDVLHNQVKELFFELNERYLTKRPGALREIPGARDFIGRLNSMESVTIAIATGGWEETARLKLEGVGIETDNLIIASSSDAHSRTEIIKLAENRALVGRNATRKTYFGDGVWDKQACEELDYNFIAIGNNVDHITRFSDFLSMEDIFFNLGL